MLLCEKHSNIVHYMKKTNTYHRALFNSNMKYQKTQMYKSRRELPGTESRKAITEHKGSWGEENGLNLNFSIVCIIW